MNRKISWGMRMCINLVRCPINSLMNGFHTKFIGLQKIALTAKVEASRTGKVTVLERSTIDGGSVCRASSGELVIGAHVYINRNCNIVSHKHVKIGNKCTIGPNVCIYDHDHDFRSNHRDTEYVCKPITIGDNVWIGSNVIIVKGVTIGDNSVIAAGVVVRTDVPPNSIYILKSEYSIKLIEKVHGERE